MEHIASDVLNAASKHRKPLVKRNKPMDSADRTDGGPAFPRPDVTGPESDTLWEGGTAGMSLRDWFAGQALAGMAVLWAGAYSDNDFVRGVPERDARWYASSAYRIADAMLTQRDKED